MRGARVPSSGMRFAAAPLTAAVLFAASYAAYALVMLAPAGQLMSLPEILAAAALAALAVGGSAVRRRLWLLAIPLAALLAFRGSLGTLIAVPRDAGVRDAQAGLGYMVVLGAEVGAVGLGILLADRRVARREGSWRGAPERPRKAAR